ncbi:MAG: methylenetetrahydrofolate reductase C-terminal domain-containing protein [Syntrophomonadales bacterium]|jgi:ferredoxin
MIVGELKALSDIKNMVKDYKKVLVVGCGGCVTVCQTGGLQEAETLARLLALDDPGITVESLAVPRQCEWEFLEQLNPVIKGYEIVVSTACGIGVQAMNEYFRDLQTLPALNTRFLGMPVQHGLFEERCQACGDCMLHLTGGICPVARCSKNLMNGPCGGSQNGKCEISKEIDCAWQLIFDRLRELNQLDRLMILQPPKDWSQSRDGGVRKMSREDLMLDDQQ